MTNEEIMEAVSEVRREVEETRRVAERILSDFNAVMAMIIDLRSAIDALSSRR